LLGFEAYTAFSSSMEPTIHQNELVYVNTKAYKGTNPSRGHIVAYKNWKFEGNIFIMRVVAVAGDSVAIKNGQLYVNDTAVVEAYLDPNRVRYPPSQAFAEMRVPSSTVFVLGDSRDTSNDSRFLGPVPVQDVTGRVRMAKESQFIGEFRDVQ
jgi:signal peptidase I